MDLLHFVIFAMGDKLPTDFVLLQKTNCLLFKTFYSLIIQQVWRLAFRSQKLLAMKYIPHGSNQTKPLGDSFNSFCFTGLIFYRFLLILDICLYKLKSFHLKYSSLDGKEMKFVSFSSTQGKTRLLNFKKIIIKWKRKFCLKSQCITNSARLIWALRAQYFNGRGIFEIMLLKRFYSLKLEKLKKR